MDVRGPARFEAGLEVVQPGLEVPSLTYPEVYYQLPEVKIDRNEKLLATTSTYIASSDEEKSNKWLSTGAGGKKAYRWLAAAIALLVVLTVAIAVPLSLKKGQQSNAATQPSSTTPPSSVVASSVPAATPTTAGLYQSKQGAYNGTGLGLIGTLDDSLQYRLIYQHASGQIRSSIRSDTWQEGGDAGIIVPLDSQNSARNGTPIAAENYQDSKNVSTYHVIYADQKNILRDRILKASGGGWKDGNLSLSNFELMVSPTAQISFIWASEWDEGDSNGGEGTNGGLKIYWTGEDNLVHEASQASGSPNWTETWTLSSDILADGGFNAFVMNSVDYLWAIKRDTMALTYYWHDYNLKGENSTSYLRGTWNEGVDSSNFVRNGSALSYGGSSLLYYQNSQDNIIGIYSNYSGPGGNLWGAQFQVGSESALPGSSLLSYSSYTTDTTGPQIRIYFQPNASTIVEWTRGVNGGTWSKDDIPVLP